MDSQSDTLVPHKADEDFPAQDVKGIFVPGTIISNRYKVVSFIGSGGMGQVLKVADLTLEGEQLALKVLYPHLATDQTTFARFKSEIMIARRLAHPNIVKLYDIGEASNGYHFITMELITGGSLGEKLKKQGKELFSFNETLKILIQIAEGIGHAHDHGVIHRDLKPDNILISTDNQIKITDFGLAKPMFVEQNFTATGETVGTPNYMAPEQFYGDRADNRCDIYALGIIAYEMVVGVRPFSGDNYLELANQHIQQPIQNFATKENEIPKWFEEMVFKAAAKQIDKRYKNIHEISELLREKLSMISGETLIRRNSQGLIKTINKIPQRKSKDYLKPGIAALLICVFILSMGTPFGGAITWGTLKSALTISLSKIGIISIKDSEIIQAINNKDHKSLENLLMSGGNPNAVDSTGTPAILLAISNNLIPIVRELLNNQANINLTDSSGNTIWNYVFILNEPSLIGDLLSANINLNIRDKDSKSPLIIAIEKITHEELLNSVIKKFLEKSALINLQDGKGRTALAWAVTKQRVEAVQILLNNGANPNLQDNYGKSPLHYAAVLRSEQIIKSLVLKGGDISLKDINGRDVLDVASYSNRKFLNELSKPQQKGVTNQEQKTDSTASKSTASTSQQTRLRLLGKPLLNVENSPNGSLFKIKVSVKNAGSFLAEGIKISAKFGSGQQFDLVGPEKVNENQTGIYSYESFKSFPLNENPKIFASCKNCY